VLFFLVFIFPPIVRQGKKTSFGFYLSSHLQRGGLLADGCIDQEVSQQQTEQ
jgi:hypothetical protein